MSHPCSVCGAPVRVKRRKCFACDKYAVAPDGKPGHALVPLALIREAAEHIQAVDDDNAHEHGCQSRVHEIAAKLAAYLEGKP